MRLASKRELVGEGEKPISALPAQRENALNDACLLIVGLLDQEGVILETLCRTIVGSIADLRRISTMVAALRLRIGWSDVNLAYGGCEEQRENDPHRYLQLGQVPCFKQS